jgi:hypothetical protein
MEPYYKEEPELIRCESNSPWMSLQLEVTVLCNCGSKTISQTDKITAPTLGIKVCSSRCRNRNRSNQKRSRMRQTVAETNTCKSKTYSGSGGLWAARSFCFGTSSACICVVLAHTLNPCVRASMIPWSRHSVTGRSRRCKLQIATARHGLTVTPSLQQQLIDADSTSAWATCSARRGDDAVHGRVTVLCSVSYSFYYSDWEMLLVFPLLAGGIRCLTC